jgi:RNA polymerase sigma factor (sigma-70 family)
MTDDNMLIVKLKQGDQAALESIYVKYRPRLMAAVCSYHVDSHQAEDVLHDVFLKVLGRIERYEITHSLYGYLRAGVLNGIRDMARRRARHETKIVTSAVSECVPCCPYEHSIRSEESRRAEKLLRVLPDSQREVVCMRIRQGLKFEEIAQVQGVSSSTARGRYRYGISRLQDLTAIQRGESPID